MNAAEAWQAYVPTRAEPWDLRKAAHLHRRAGFGATGAELQRDLHEGPERSVTRLLQPRPLDDDERQLLDSLREGVIGSADSERLKAWWLYRVCFGVDPLGEKMTLFWHNHFATSNRKVKDVVLMLRQNELLRQQALGNFGDLLRAILEDGAMLLWLDGAGSRKAKPNENLAREFLELFTLGTGQYTEMDVREAARAFAGWMVDRTSTLRQEATFYRDRSQEDLGRKTFLKQTGPWESADIVRIVLEQPATALLLCRKLYRFFISEADEPAPELLEPLAEKCRRANYSVRQLVETILRSRLFFSSAVCRQRVKSPVEFSAGLVRVLEVPRAEVSLLALAATCEAQGQNLFDPPSVKGWGGGRAWLNSNTLLQRSNWIADVVWGNAELGMTAYDPIRWARQASVEPRQAAESLLALLLQGDVNSEARALVLETARIPLTPTHSHPGRRGSTDESAAGLRRALQLMLHCPAFQLA